MTPSVHGPHEHPSRAGLCPRVDGQVARGYDSMARSEPSVHSLPPAPTKVQHQSPGPAKSCELCGHSGFGGSPLPSHR